MTDTYTKGPVLLYIDGSKATFAQQSQMGRGEPGALIEYKQKPLKGWFLKGPPQTPQTLPVRFTVYPATAGLVEIGATLISVLLAGNTHQGLGALESSRHLTPTTCHWGSTVNPLTLYLKRNPP
jgi:hypothetical protein